MKGFINLFFTFIWVAIAAAIVAFSYVDQSWISICTGMFIAIIVVYFFNIEIKSIPLLKLFLILIFTILIFIPFAGSKENQSLENRKLAQFPEFRVSNVWKFFEQYADYFEDRFAFRSTIIDLYGNLRIKFFGLSPVAVVEICKDDWLFSSGPYYQIVSSTPFSDQELKLIELNLEITTLWLEKRNIQYYFVGTPIKARIYYEKLTISLQNNRKFSKIDQIYTYISNNKKIKSIDVRPDLINGKKTRDTYMKSDTHWNEFGAFLAYRKIMETIKFDLPDIHILKVEDFAIDSVLNDNADLVKLMGIKSGFPFYEYKLINKSGIKIQIIDSMVPGTYLNHILFSNYPQSKNKYKIYFVRDSMTQYLQKFFSLSFNRVFYQWSPIMDTHQVIQEEPNIIIHEMQELFLSHLLKLPDYISADTTFINQEFPEYYEIQRKVDFSKVVYF